MKRAFDFVACATLCAVVWSQNPVTAQTSDLSSKRVEDTVLVEIVTVNEFFKETQYVPIDMISWEDDATGAMKFAVAELEIGDSDRHVIALRGLEDRDDIAATMTLADGVAVAETSAGAAATVGSLMINNFTEWCGRWHDGIRGRWRVCTGNDCRRTNDPIFQPMVCIQRRS